MNAPAAAGDSSAAPDAAPRYALPLLLVLAGAYFALAIPFGLELGDSGMILLPSRRVMHGAVPYRDFIHMYGPSLFYVNGALLAAVGSGLYALRWAVLAIKLTTVALVYLCARQMASPGRSVLAAALTTAIWGAPWWLFNTPYANHYALTLSLAGLWLSLALPAPLLARSAAAGLCFGLAATFKQTSGLFGLLAFSVGLVLAPGASLPGAPAWLHGRLGAAVRWAVIGVTGLMIATYLAPHSDWWTRLVLGLPTLVLLGEAAHREWRGALPAGERAAGVAAIVVAGLAAAVPVAAWIAFFAVEGALRAFVFSTISGLPQSLLWFDPYFRPAWPAWLAAGGIVALAIGLWRRRRAPWVAAAIAAVAVAGVAAGGGWNGAAFGVLALLLPAIAWGGVIALRPGARPWPSPALVRFAAFGAVSLAFLYPSGDFWHVAMAAPGFLPLAAGLSARWPTRGTWWIPTAAAVAVALLLAAPFVHALAATAAAGGAAPTSGPLRGIVAPPPGGPAADVVANALRQRPGAPLLAVTADSLFYILSERDSALPAGEFTLYLIGFGLVDDGVARALLPESQVIDVLQAARPTLVESAATRHLFRRVYPAAAAAIDAHYRVAVDAPPYRVLEWAS